VGAAPAGLRIYGSFWVAFRGGGEEFWFDVPYCCHDRDVFLTVSDFLVAFLPWGEGNFKLEVNVTRRRNTQLGGIYKASRR